MSIIVLQEERLYSYLELKEIFKIYDDVSLKDYLKRLLDTGTLKVHNVEEDLEYLNKDDTIESEDNGKYKFKYVGAIQIQNNICMIIYPKYFSEESIKKDIEDNLTKFKVILEVIESYSKKKVQRLSTIDKNDNNKSEMLGIKLAILNDFYNNGIYHKERKEIKLDCEGKISWNHTISRSEAFIVEDTPIYLNTYNERTSEILNDIIQIIQKSILYEISNDLNLVLELLGYDSVYLSNTYLEDIGDYDYLLDTIINELNIEYVSKRRKTLMYLYTYIKSKSNADGGNEMLIGTKAFNMVWEDVCSVVYGNDLNLTFHQLGLLTPRVEDQNILLKNYLEKPKWRTNFNEEIIESGGNLRIDVLKIDGKNINIYDAKYYSLKFVDSRILGAPSVNDIVKQYVYQLSFKSIIELNNLKVSNNFIIPKDDYSLEDNVVIGNAFLNIFSEIDLEPINIIFRDAQTMYFKYLK